MAKTKNMDKLLEETIKKMEMLSEYSFYRNSTHEADDNQDNNQDMNTPAMGGNQPQDNGGGMDMGMNNNQPQSNGMDNNQGQDNGGMDMNMGDDQNQDNGMDMGDDNMDNDMEGGDDNTDFDMGDGEEGNDMDMNDDMEGGDDTDFDMEGNDDTDFDMGGETPGADDDVIDVSELTDMQSEIKQGQEELSQKQDEQMSDIDSTFQTLMKVLKKYSSALDLQDKKLNDLKKEFAKRNPTEEEIMNVRLHAGGNPFDEKPEEYWNKFKDINNHYKITANNDAPQYQIKKSDIDNFNDRMLDDDFNTIPRTLKEYFIR